MPITISCYTFHPLIQRFVRLYRHVQVVSTWLACLLSVFCCSCAGAMPGVTGASSESTSSNEKTSVVTIDSGPSKEHVIDFLPAAGDSDFTEKGNRELSNEFEGVVVAPVKITESIIKDMSTVVLVHKKPVPAVVIAERHRLPSLIQNQATLEKTLNQSQVEKCGKY